ncbi:LysR family transcriptional regulator [Arenibaculum pallidiluteum]|uniref:LysR family transcriptional regulator n=1 Tax=Arenibaculum pallidiluteum TaxID=2812559 RepID=UPI001A97CA0A|nr:LysR family transcriptional regulator [Arenibaculum pallidiluteum]
MDRIDELEILVAVVETGSLAGAARRLGRSAPAVTRGLAALERRVGLRLVERTTRRLAPTEAGRELADQGRRLASEYEGAISAASSAPLRGLLRITAPLAFGRRHVTAAVASFLDLHPGIDVELNLHDRNLDLIEERLHIAVRIGRLSDSGLVARRVGSVRRVVVAAPDYLARRGSPQAPEDLLGHDTIVATGVTTVSEWRFGPGADIGAALGKGGRSVRLAPRLRVNDVDAALQAVRAGRGIARALSYQAAEDLAAGRMVRLLRAFEPDPLPVQVVVPSGGALPPKVRAFLDHAVRCFEALPEIQDEG